MTHKTSITGFDSLQDAAQEIGKMRYDALSIFLYELNEEMREQQIKDRNAGKKQLVIDSYELIKILDDAGNEADRLFKKYKHFMKDELDDDDGSSL